MPVLVLSEGTVLWLQATALPGDEHFSIHAADSDTSKGRVPVHRPIIRSPPHLYTLCVPRLPRIRLRALDELARQLRFSPRAAAARHVRAVLELAEGIDPARAYAEDWVARRITGFRADVSDPIQLVGEALLADLSAFAERVSAQSRLESSDLDQPLVTPRALGERWAVSARTLERYRRRGLIGVRVSSASVGVQLMFPMSAITRFERRMGPLLGAAHAYERTTPAHQSRIIEAALSHRAATGASLARTAAVVAPKLGVSSGKVRRVLREKAAPSFDVIKRAGVRERELAFRAWVRGVGPSAIAERLKTTRATVHRVINAERAARLRALDLAGPTSRRFEESGAARAFLAAALVREGLGNPGDLDAAQLARASGVHIAADPKREKALAEAYLFLVWRARASIALLKTSPGGEPLDRIETDLRWASLLKVELIRGERPLIVRTLEERAGSRLLELTPAEIRRWVAAAFHEAAEAVDRFDPFKRGRLATPISLALARGLSGLRPSASSRRAQPTTLPIEDWSRGVCAWQSWLDAPARLRRIVSRDAAINHRFGLRLGPPLTLEELKREHALSPARLWAAMRNPTKIAC